MATASPETADQTPIAMARSRATVNTLLSMASVAGYTRAAAAPIRARAAISSPVVRDSAAPTENTANNSRPSCRSRRLPRRSPRLPPSSSSPAKESV